MPTEEYIRLVPLSITKTMKMGDVYIFMLRHNPDKRVVPVIVTHEDSELIYAALHSNPPSFVSLVRSMIHSFDMQVEQVVIHFPYRGYAAAQIQLRQGETTRSLPTDVGIGVCVALALHADISMSAEDYNTLTRHDSEPTRVTMPMSFMSTGLLRVALKDAVRDERFEMASLLRDELRMREDGASATPESAPTDTSPPGE